MNALFLQIVSVLLVAIKRKETQDEVLDFLEDLIQRTETKMDDRALLPLIKAYRQIADVPDGDD